MNRKTLAAKERSRYELSVCPQPEDVWISMTTVVDPAPVDLDAIEAAIRKNPDATGIIVDKVIYKLDKSFNQAMSDKYGEEK